MSANINSRSKKMMSVHDMKFLLEVQSLITASRTDLIKMKIKSGKYYNNLIQKRKKKEKEN